MVSPLCASPVNASSIGEPLAELCDEIGCLMPSPEVSLLRRVDAVAALLRLALEVPPLRSWPLSDGASRKGEVDLAARDVLGGVRTAWSDIDTWQDRRYQPNFDN